MKVTEATTYGELAIERARLGIVSLTIRTIVPDGVVDPALIGRRWATARLAFGGLVEVTGADDIEALDNLFRTVEQVVGLEARMRAKYPENYDPATVPSGQHIALVTPHPCLGPVCTTCKDTHEMQLEDQKVMCTHCPTPCDDCRAGGNGAYCTTTPCSCHCHAKRRAELEALLQ